MPKKSIRQILADNVNALMQEGRNDLSSNPTLAARTGLGTGTISRVRNAVQDATIDTVERIASAYGLHAIDLLLVHHGRIVAIEAKAVTASDADNAKYFLKRKPAGITQEEQRLLDLFRTMGPEQRRPLFDMATTLAEVARQVQGSPSSPLANDGTR